jgi:putative transposase
MAARSVRAFRQRIVLASLDPEYYRAGKELCKELGVKRRWVGSCRRELLDHVIALNERHMKRLLCEYVSYHDEDRTHLGLDKETPRRRTHSLPSGHISSRPRLGGLHNRYDRAA